MAADLRLQRRPDLGVGEMMNGQRVLGLSFVLILTGAFASASHAQSAGHYTRVTTHSKTSAAITSARTQAARVATGSRIRPSSTSDPGNDTLHPYAARAQSNPEDAATTSSQRTYQQPTPVERPAPQSRNYYPTLRSATHPNANVVAPRVRPHICTPSRARMLGSMGGSRSR